ncbi:DUF3883 domain-containing protein [Phenylobacterium sp.]|uniref:DUF3883 domain-containing protein n=1 Tax=Phenylobacterium sp. TaxID=1871053 RepID=UPI002FE35A85
MPDQRFREWVRTELQQEGAALSSYVSTATRLEKAFQIRSLTLAELRALEAEIADAPGRTGPDGRNFVLRRGGKRHELDPNVRVRLRQYIRFREETGVRPVRDGTASRPSRTPAGGGSADRNYRRLTSRKAVFAAMAECRRVTEKQLRATYRFGPSRGYVARYEGHEYPSKAIVGIAFRFQFPEVGALTPHDLSGGESGAARHLSRLGFDVDGVARDPNDWSVEEVEFIVELYFAMWASQQRKGYERRSYLQQALARLAPRRNEGAIGRKLSNISAIVEGLGLPVLRGFPALGNKQTLLTAVVTDWLDDHPDSFGGLPAAPLQIPDAQDLEVPPPPAAKLGDVRRDRRGCKVDFAAQDERNRALGRAGEEWAVEFLKKDLRDKGRADLAEKVAWVSETIGDGLGYDIECSASDGSPLYVEVKTTNQGINSPFVVSANEIRASQQLGAAYVLLRIFNFSDRPQVYRLTGDLSEACDLRPLSYSAAPTSSQGVANAAKPVAQAKSKAAA